MDTGGEAPGVHFKGVFMAKEIFLIWVIVFSFMLLGTSVTAICLRIRKKDPAFFDLISMLLIVMVAINWLIVIILG